MGTFVKVLLENAYLTQETISNTQTRTSQMKQVIKGTVRVMNLDFHKSVYVRYTYTDWKDFTDFQVIANKFSSNSSYFTCIVPKTYLYPIMTHRQRTCQAAATGSATVSSLE